MGALREDGIRRSSTYLQVGIEDVALDFIHSVCSIGDSAQMESLEYHLVLSESPCDGESSSSEDGQLGKALLLCEELWPGRLLGALLTVPGTPVRDAKSQQNAHSDREP